MSCCGQKRAAQRAGSDLARAQKEGGLIPSIETARQDEKGRTVLRYVGKGTLSLAGPRTGNVYYFDEAGEGTAVEEKDVDALLLTRLFERREDEVGPRPTW